MNADANKASRQEEALATMPFIVEVELGQGGLVTKLNVIHTWCAENCGRLFTDYGISQRMEGSGAEDRTEYSRWHFRDFGHADAFALRFGGRRLRRQAEPGQT